MIAKKKKRGEKMEKNKLSDDQYEEFILGAVMNDKYAQHQALQELQVDDFYNIHHREIFKAFCEVAESGRKVERRTVADALKNLGSLDEIGGILKLNDLLLLGTNVDVEYYIAEIKSLSSRRKLISIAHDMAKRAADSSYGSVDLIDRYNREISSIGVYSRDKFDDMKSIMENFKDGKDFMSVITEECARVAMGEDLFDGVRSYYPRLDQLIGGFARGTNNIIGARSSSGKTTFLSNLFLNIHENAPHVRMGFFSLEMNKSRIMEKVICTMADIRYKDLQERNLTPFDFERLVTSEKNIKSMKLTIFDRAGININEFKSHIRRETIRNGLDIVFLDYLSIIQAFHKTGNKHQEIDQVSKGLQSIALELNIPIVTLSQLNRAIYGRTDKSPVLSDLRESGSIEEDADLVMLLHRPIHYVASNEPAIEDVTQLIVAKNRLRGDLGKVEYDFRGGRYKERQRIEDIRPNNVVNSNEKKEDWRPPSSY